MSHSVGLNPILIIGFQFIGFALGGVIGALISVTMVGPILVIVRHLVIEPRKEAAAPHLVEGGILLPPTKKAPKEIKPVILTPDQTRGTTPTA
jgi:hypothetical protein